MVLNPTVLEVAKVSFSYGAETSPILEDLTLRTCASEICAIVGPSGCGKTTLIKMILSLLPVTRGSIRLFGRDAGDPSTGVPGPNVGYMPQEDALPSDLRVRDSLIFFGLLNNMTIRDTRKRLEEVLEQVGLIENSQKFTHQLSGGMRRRLSLAIALLHSPQLLILDEPTVGCDPILRSRIWKVLRDISEQNRACVLITTHYYEECRNADSINFMRDKSFVVQADPEKVMEVTGARTMDEALLRICINKYSSPPVFSEIGHEVNKLKTFILTCDNVVFEDGNYEKIRNFQNIRFLAIKIVMILVLRYIHAFVFDITSVLATLSLPTVVSLLAHFCATPLISDVPVGLVIENQTLFYDKQLVDQISIKPECIECLHPRNFVNYMDPQMFRVFDYTDLTTAMEDLKKKKINGVIHIGDQFGEYFTQRVALHWVELGETVAKSTKIVYYGDTTEQMVFRGIEAHLMDAYTNFWKASRINLGMKSSALFPFEYEDPQVGSKGKGKNFKSYFTDLGQLLMNINSITIGISAFSMLNELKDQTMQRCFSIGIKSHHLFAAQMLANGLFLGFSSLSGIFTVINLLDLPRQYSLSTAALLIFCQVLTDIVLGQLIAVALFSEVAIMIMSLLLGLFFCGACGFLIPLETQPYYMEALRYFSPFTLQAMSMRKALFYGLTLENKMVLQGVAISIAYFIIFSGINLHISRKRIFELK